MNEPIWKSRNLPRRLTEDLLLPAEAPWRREFAPELSYGRHAGPARGDARLAAVAIVLCWDGAEWALPLTVRCAALARHAGQLSLPGGLVDAGEIAGDAAGRELEEELGLRPALTWLGDLPPLFVFASNALVTPCVAVVDHWPSWRPSESEVDCVLKLSIRQLLEAEPAPPLEMARGPLRFWAPRFIVEGQSAWGATAVMLAELRGRLERVNHEI